MVNDDKGKGLIFFSYLLSRVVIFFCVVCLFFYILFKKGFCGMEMMLESIIENFI